MVWKEENTAHGGGGGGGGGGGSGGVGKKKPLQGGGGGEKLGSAVLWLLTFPRGKQPGFSMHRIMGLESYLI